MSVSEKISSQMKDAMRAKQADRLSALRMIKAELDKSQLDTGKALDDAGEQDVLKRLAKQRRESIESFRSGGREEMAMKEEAELAVIMEFLPEELSPEEIDRVIDACLAELGAADASKMGQVVGAVMKALKATGGMFDGKAVNQRVRERLSG
jgi:uncharacterized protein